MNKMMKERVRVRLRIFTVISQFILLPGVISFLTGASALGQTATGSVLAFVLIVTTAILPVSVVVTLVVLGGVTKGRTSWIWLKVGKCYKVLHRVDEGLRREKTSLLLGEHETEYRLYVEFDCRLPQIVNDDSNIIILEQRDDLRVVDKLKGVTVLIIDDLLEADSSKAETSSGELQNPAS
jgi:hypothetical protein